MRVSLRPVNADKTQRDPQKPARGISASSDHKWQSETPFPHRITQQKQFVLDLEVDRKLDAHWHVVVRENRSLTPAMTSDHSEQMTVTASWSAGVPPWRCHGPPGLRGHPLRLAGAH